MKKLLTKNVPLKISGMAILIWISFLVGVAWAANTKLSALTELAVTPDATDEFYVNDGGTSKKIQYSTLMNGASPGTLTTIKEDDTGVGGADIVTLDFLGADFDLAETPDTEVQVVIAAAIARDSELHDAVTIGTANGLTLSTQRLSLAAATNATPGAATAAQITALETVDGLVNQSVVTASAPTFTADNFSDGGSNAIITTTQESNFGSAYSHVSSNGSDHSYIDQSVTSGASPTFTTVTGDVSGNAGTVTNGVYRTDNLSVLSSTTSDQLAGVISNETGSGVVVFGTSPTFTTSTTITDGGDIDSDGIDLVTGNDYQINNTSVLNATTLGSAVVTSSLTTVGTLGSGGISSGFGAIDTGASNIITTGTIGASGAAIANGVTATTQSASDGSTKVATTAYVDNLIFQSLAVAGLGDTTTPSVLTTAETINKCISNYKSSGADHVFTMPAAHAAGNIIFSIGDEFQVDIEPNGSDLFYLNGTAMDADEHIQNPDDTLGERIVGYCVNINGTLRWMFYSSDTAWVEATP